MNSSLPPTTEGKVPKKEKKTGSLALVLSVLFHSAILLMIGGIVLIPAVMQKEAFNGDTSTIAHQEAPMDEPPMDDPSVNELPASQAPPDQMEISEPTPTTAPNVDIVVTREDANSSSSWTHTSIGASLPSFNTKNALKQDSGSPSASTEKPKTGLKIANLFGKEVASSKLGVVLDISGSTHSLIDIPLVEIEKSFPDAIIVLATGCGMSAKAKGEVLPADDYLKNKNNTQFTSRFFPQTWLDRLLVANKNFEKIWLKAKREKRIHVVYLENNIPTDNKNAPTLTVIYGTSLAFDFLRAQKVDTIYWFSDFQDAILQDIGTTLGKDLKKDRIKVIQHNFSKPLPPERFPLAKATGGDIIQTQVTDPAKDKDPKKK